MVYLWQQIWRPAETTTLQMRDWCFDYSFSCIRHNIFFKQSRWQTVVLTGSQATPDHTDLQLKWPLAFPQNSLKNYQEHKADKIIFSEFLSNEVTLGLIWLAAQMAFGSSFNQIRGNAKDALSEKHSRSRVLGGPESKHETENNTRRKLPLHTSSMQVSKSSMFC